MKHMIIPSDTRDLTVQSRIDDRGDIVRLVLVAPGGADLPEVTAGAHIDVRIPVGDDLVWRSYSLAGDPGDRSAWHLGILNEAEGRGGSRTLVQTAQGGAVLATDGPRNHFALVRGAWRSVLIGGGVGITPLLSMGHELAGQGAEWSLHYCTRGPDRAAFGDVLGAAPFAGRTHLHHDGTDSAFDPSMLPAPEAGTHLYVCGPEGFMDWVIAAARAQGHAAANIHQEYFSAVVA